MITTNQEDMQVQILEYIKNHDLAVVSTVNEKHKPQAATVGYFFDEDNTFYFMTRTSTRKVANIKANPNVAIVVGTMMSPNTVQMEGEAQILNSGQDEFKALLVKFAGLKILYNGPFLKLEGIDFVIIKVKINWLRWLDYNNLTHKEEFFQLFP